MAVPPLTQFHRPVLETIAQSESSLTIRQIMDLTAGRMSLTSSDKQEQEANGAFKWEKRVRWSVHYLKAYGGLISSPGYRLYEATTHGREYLTEHAGPISTQDLTALKSKQSEGPEIPGDRDTAGSENVGTATEVISRRSGHSSLPDQTIGSEILDDTGATPDELIQAGYDQLQEALMDDLRGAVSSLDPTQFELLAIALLEKMGYGKGQHTGGRGDGGIDGVLRQDPLGLGSVCCVQAKRWGQAVGDDVIRTFSGSIERFGSSLGVIVTTDRFANTAVETARAYSVGNKVIRLIGGEDLILLMMAHGIGVVTESVYEIKRVDTTYFERF